MALQPTPESAGALDSAADEDGRRLSGERKGFVLWRRRSGAFAAILGQHGEVVRVEMHKDSGAAKAAAAKWLGSWRDGRAGAHAVKLLKRGTRAGDVHSWSWYGSVGYDGFHRIDARWREFVDPESLAIIEREYQAIAQTVERGGQVEGQRI